ncbi:putative leucine-rich repeat domain superfamily [Helianthus debilis subsp. tardiflorus]
MHTFGFRSCPSFNCIWWFFDWFSGIHSSFCKTKGEFEIFDLNEMRNLRLLQLNYVQLSGSYENFPQGIRWLCMHGFSLSYIPSDLQMENLVALDMSNSKLQQLWKKPKLLRSLKFLNLSTCQELVRVGPFSGLPLLERLTLTGCTSLVEVCESIGACCQQLEVFDLSKCNKLKKLPRSIGKLKNIAQLLIHGCSNLREFPEEIKDMESLKVLVADNINMKSHGSSSCTMIQRSSKSIVSSLPRTLVTLSLRNCNLYNESFPMDLSSLSMLKRLYLDENPIDSMPDCVRSLCRLEELTFEACYNLKTVLGTPILLGYMAIDYCHSLEKITFHPETSALPYVAYRHSHFTLTEIQHKFKIQAISEIDEEVLRSLGWINVAYLNNFSFWKANSEGMYYLPGRVLSEQILYEHGIFSTYLQGQEVPTWFNHKSDESLFTLQSSPNNGTIQGLNVCIVSTISSLNDVGPSRIEISNLVSPSTEDREQT